MGWAMMRRYRVGDTFRPPTTAESAALADALEGFRNRPPSPQDQPPYGQTIVVKTPAAGIAARSSMTLSSAVCTRCIETSEADEKTLKDTDEEIIVFNLAPMAVPGDYYVKTNLTASGTRYAETVAYAWHRATLGAILNQGSTATATLIGPSTTITVQDRFLGTGETLASGVVVGVEYDPWQEEWVATEAPCS